MEVLHFHMTRFFVRDDITDSRFIIKSKRFNSMSSHREATLQGHTKNFEIVASNIIHYYCEVALIEASSLKLRRTDISKMWKKGNWNHGKRVLFAFDNFLGFGNSLFVSIWHKVVPSSTSKSVRTQIFKLFSRQFLDFDIGAPVLS